MMQEKDRERIIEDAEEAKRLLAPASIFNRIVSELLAEHVETLLNVPVGDLTAASAHASMKSLNDIKIRMRTFVTNANFEAKKGHI